MKAQQPDFGGVTEMVVLITSLIEVRDLAVRTFNRDEGNERSYSDFHTIWGIYRDDTKKNILKCLVEL